MLDGGARPDTMDAACAITSMRTSISTAVDAAAELAAAPTRYTPRSLHSVGTAENLTLTVRAAIDDTGATPNAKANVIMGIGTDNIRVLLTLRRLVTATTP
jgi:hypothetical protein